MAHDQPVVPVEAEDGHRFELIEVGPEAARQTLMLVPGMGVSARHCIGFARALAGFGVRTLIHEWRGNGSSNQRAGRDCNWTYRELVHLDLDASLAAAVEAGSGDAVWVAGHSLGSQLACLSAATAADRVRGLVLIAGGSPFWKTFPRLHQPVLWGLLHLLPALASAVGHFPGRRVAFAGNEAVGVMRDWARTGRTGHYRLDSLDFDPEHALAELECPVQLLSMEHDRYVPIDSADWLLGKLPRCPVERTTITSDEQGARADHFAWMRHPKATAARVGAWLERIRVD